VTVELRNVGEDPHDLVLSPDGSHSPLASFGETASGGRVTRSLTLPAGRYYLYCSLPNHEALGMSAHLQVR
jgi:plastocyanin